MKSKSRIHLGLFVTALGALCALVGLRAEDTVARPDQAARFDDLMPVAMTTAVDPKPLSNQVQKALEYLVKTQHANGGWGQGGGWRISNAQGGRVEGADVNDPPDVGNTCVATLALIRAGNTPTHGPYANHVARAIDFICGHIEKSDRTSLYVTDIRDTQLQSKIGPYVDTFMATLVLAEVKGRMPDSATAQRMEAALNKTIAKIERHQKKDGTFAGNDGWASVLSQGVANKALNRAAQFGALVNDATLENVQNQVVTNYNVARVGTAATTASALEVEESTVIREGPGGLGGRSGVARALSAPTDAGVALYKDSANLAGAQELVNSGTRNEKKAMQILSLGNAAPTERNWAENQLKNLGEARKVQLDSIREVTRQLENKEFIAGFGSNGGEEFLSFMNISETLLVKGGTEWQKWDRTVTTNLNRVQDKDGSWSGQHCITGRTFCTGSALLVLLADRTPVPVEMKKIAK